jgi:hypothetical protein
MDQSAINKLHLQPRTDTELHAALDSFELKWQHKANRLQNNGRISRF